MGTTSRQAKAAIRKRAKTPVRKQRGGRPIGSPNKRTAEVLEQLEGLKCDPFAFLAATMLNDRKALGLPHRQRDPDVAFKYRVEAAKELAHYIAPKRKAMDITSDGKSIEDTFKAAVDNLNKGDK